MQAQHAADYAVNKNRRKAATRMSALLTGEIDFVLDPPLQDIPRLKREARVRIIEGPENRVIFLGMRIRVAGLPRAQFFQKLERRDSSFLLYGWGGAPGDGTTFLTPLVHSFDGKGRGDFNMGRFADSDVDRAIDRASGEMDDATREALLAGAATRIRDQAYLIPLHRQVIPWAARAGVSVVHRADNVLSVIWVKVPPR